MIIFNVNCFLWTSFFESLALVFWKYWARILCFFVGVHLQYGFHVGLLKSTKGYCPIYPDRARIMGHPINAYCSELLRRRRRQPPMMSSSNWKIFWVRIVVRVTDLCTNNRQADRQGIWQKTLKLLKKCPQNYDENKMSDINRFFEPKLNVSLTILYKDMENFYTKAKIESNGETWGFSFMILFDICICVIYIYICTHE